VNLFDQLVSVAMQRQQSLIALRPVVEKELLHHDILRVLSQEGLLHQLTFMGGTCLRACYGASRLSEDLDFTGGQDFTRHQLSTMGQLLSECLQAKYGLKVEVEEPVREQGNVDTWKLRVQTRPGQKDLPAQRINIDVCAIPSYQVRPMVLLNAYGVDMGTNGLILRAQSREEIFADKLLAFALRPNRLKHRDIWDMAWLTQQKVRPAIDLLVLKLSDHKVTKPEFVEAFQKRLGLLKNQPQMAIEFQKEMSRFLPNQIVKENINSELYWTYICNLMSDFESLIS
jgi:predicted nucleotidyltransferase component of viral defense system